MSDKMVVYREIIPQGRVYYLIMNGGILLLIILTLIFIATNIWAGAVSTSLTAIFLVFVRATTKKAELIVTNQEFIMKFWFLTFKTKLSDIDTVEIKDVSLLPKPYQGHVKFWVRGIKFFDGLRVFRLRDGDAVHIKTKKGQTIIVTSQNNQGFAETLKKQKEALW